MNVFRSCGVWLGLLLGATPGLAEQSKSLNGYTVHYSVVNSTFLTPEVARRYNVVRAETQAVLTLSILDETDQSVPAKVTGVFVNLLSQEWPLTFQSINEGDAHYSIATFKFTSEELLKFRIRLDLPEGEQVLAFQQKVFAP